MAFRLIRGVLFLALIGAGAVLGSTGAALGTAAGRDALIDFALAWANRSLRGTLAVGASDGAPLKGLTLYDVSLVDTAGRRVVAIGSATVRYRIRELLRSRIVLGQLSLDRPVLTLRRTADDRWNFAEVLRLGEGDRPGVSPLVAFRDVRVDGAVVEIDGETPRTVAITAARLPYLRLSSPLPGEDAIHVEVGSAAFTLSDPAMRVADLAGTVDILADSLLLDLTSVRLANSTATIAGWLRPDGAATRFDVLVDADRLDVTDLASFTTTLPRAVRTATGRARVRIARRAPGSLTVEADRVAMTPGDGGALTGRVAFSTAPDGRWALMDTDLRSEDASVSLLRALLDSVPLDGRLSGRTRADGPAERLVVRLDWRFEDTAVPGNPVTTVQADGTVALGGDDGVRFLDLGVTRAAVALATVERFVPAVALRGIVDGAGTLMGPWKDVTFSGTLRHRDGALPVTMARGVVHLDTRGDTLNVEANLAFDSLATDGLRPSYPALVLDGSWAGDVRVAGAMSGLEVAADLAGPEGVFRGSGHVMLGEDLRGVEQLDVFFQNATVGPLRSRFPDTRLNGHVGGSVAFDTALVAMDLGVTLTPSTLAAVPLDSLTARFSTGDGRLRVDTLVLWAAHVRAAGRGAVGMSSGVRDSVRVVLSVDSLADLVPLIARYAGDTAAAWVPDSVRGSMEVTVVVSGDVDALDLALDAEARDARWDQFSAPAAHARWSRAAAGDTRVSLRADSIGVGDFGFGSVQLVIEGGRARQLFQVRGRLGDYAALLAGGVLAFDTAGLGIRFDSLAMLAGRSVWLLERPATVAITDSAFRFDDVSVAPPTGGSRIRVAGALPRIGPGALDVRVESLRLDELWAVLQHDPDLAGGELSGTLTVAGTARAPVIEASLALREGVVGEFRAPYVEATASYGDRRLDGTVRLFRLGDEILGVTVGLPVDFALRDAPARRRLPGPITIRARATDVDLALLDAISPAVRRTSGRFSADFGITGTWDRPELTGFVTVADGAASFPALGVRHERINGGVVMAGDSIRIDRLSLASGGGTAEVTGTVRLEELTSARLAIAIQANDFHAIDVPDFVVATVSGEVQLTGPLSRATLTGRGTIPRGVVWFADIVEKDIINLEDTMYAGLVDRDLLRRQGLGSEFENRFLDSLTIDGLRLSMGNDVWLRSNEANIQLTGDLTVGKVAQRYRIDGILATPRGSYRLQLVPLVEGLEREFLVTRGQVQYFGTADLDAALDIDARHVLRTRQGDNVTILVHVGGTIYAPTLTLSSDHRPALSDTEIISYLLVGAPSVAAAGRGGVRQFSGDVFEGFAEAIAARLVSNRVGGAISDLGVPIDYFEIRPQFAARGAGTQISVGRRLSERVFVTVNPRYCPSAVWELHNLGFALEYRLSRAWRFAVAADPLGSCGLFGGEQSTLRYQLGLDLLWETSY